MVKAGTIARLSHGVYVRLARTPRRRISSGLAKTVSTARSSTGAAIRERIYRMPAGKTFTAATFGQRGTQAALYPIFSRLVKEGTIGRLSFGVYARLDKARYRPKAVRLLRLAELPEHTQRALTEAIQLGKRLDTMNQKRLDGLIARGLVEVLPSGKVRVAAKVLRLYRASLPG